MALSAESSDSRRASYSRRRKRPAATLHRREDLIPGDPDIPQLIVAHGVEMLIVATDASFARNRCSQGLPERMAPRQGLGHGSPDGSDAEHGALLRNKWSADCRTSRVRFQPDFAAARRLFQLCEICVGFTQN